MPVFKVQAPDGTVIKVEAADQATAIRGAQEHHASAKAPQADPEAMKPKWGIPVVGDFARSAGQALDAVKTAAADQYKTGSTPQKPRLVDMIPGFSPQDKALGRLAGSVLGLAAPVTEAFTRPVARGMSATLGGTTEEANQLLNTALMGARPGAGRVPSLTSLPLPTGPTPLARPLVQGGRYVERVAKSSGVKPEALTASPKPVIAAEALGKPGQVALGALARRQGETGDALAATIGERQITRGPRIQQDFAQAVGISPEAAAGDIQALVDNGRKAAAPLYERAYAVGGVDTPNLSLLVGRPSMQMAMSRAVRIAAEEGRDPAELGFRVVKRASEGPAGSVTNTRRGSFGEPIETTTSHQAPGELMDHHVQVENPSAQTWDYVKRGIDDVLNGYRDKTTGRLHLDEQGRAILGTSKALREELIKANPAYGEALATSGDYLSADQAFRDGGKFVFNGQMTERQVEAHIAKLTPGEREAFKGGIANRIFDLSQNNRLDPKVLRTPRVRAKLELALGKDQARQLIASASDEGAMQAFERRYGPAANSLTAEMAQAMSDQDGVGVAGQIAGDLIGNLHRGPVGAVTSAIGNQIKNLGAMARTPGMSVAARNEAGRLLMLPPDQLAAYLKMRAATKPKLPSGVGRIGYATEGVLPPPRKPTPRKD